MDIKHRDGFWPAPERPCDLSFIPCVKTQFRLNHQLSPGRRPGPNSRYQKGPGIEARVTAYGCRNLELIPLIPTPKTLR